MKHCNICNTEKDNSLFHKRKASKDGLAARCKSCQKEYDDSRLKDPRRMQARRDYQKSKVGKDAHARAVKKWQEKNAIKRGVHIITGNAIRDGRLIKRPCEVCGNKNVNAHHDDYALPFSVRWMCDEHHSEWHRINGEGDNAQ